MFAGWVIVYKIMHFFFSFFLVSKAARVACSNTSLTPSLVLAEHSRYFWAPIFLRTSSACGSRVSVLVFHRWLRIVLLDHSYLLGCHRLLRCLVQLLNSLLVVSQVLLAADENDGEARTEVQDFRDPL